MKKSITVGLAPADTKHLPTYRRKNGTLEKISQRDPGRRYGHVTDVQTSESYFLEYSDEGERDADAQKAKWDAEAPERAATALNQEKELEAFRSTFKYDTRLFAFIDILGWSEAVRASATVNDAAKTRELGIVLSYLLHAVNFNKQTRVMARDSGHAWPGDVLMTQFSDCLVISAKDDRSGRDSLVMLLWGLAHNMMHSGYFLRGGVVRGPIYHSESGVYGPALLDAYHLESKIAKNPRIVLSEELAAEWGQGEEGPDGQFRTWRIDSDKNYYFDFMQPFGGSTFFANAAGAWQQDLEKLRSVTLEGLSIHRGSKKILQKYIWLAQYFNEIRNQCVAHGIQTADVISLRKPSIFRRLIAALNMRKLG